MSLTNNRTPITDFVFQGQPLLNNPERFPGNAIPGRVNQSDVAWLNALRSRENVHRQGLIFTPSNRFTFINYQKGAVSVGATPLR